MRRPTLLTRTFRVYTALVTVWCLGCAAFDPLIAKLAAQSESPVRLRAYEGWSYTSASTTTNRSDQPSAGAAVSDEDLGGATCDCQSCLAPAPAALAVAPPSPPAADVPVIRFATPTSFERAPLVPPPQTVA